MVMRHLIHILVVALLLSSCQKDEVLSGVIETTSPFEKIEVDGSFDVLLSEDSVFSVQFEADKSFFDALSFDVTDGVLRISDGKSPRWRNPGAKKPIVKIRGNQLREIKLLETCFLKSETPIKSDELGLVAFSKLNQAELELDCKVFYFWNNHPCGGEIKLRGKIDELKIWNFAIMRVDASACKTRYAWVENSSKADVLVDVNEQIDYAIGGKGNIYVEGNPAKIVELKPATDDGKLIIYL
jgi:hypothetical protein